MNPSLNSNNIFSSKNDTTEKEEPKKKKENNRYPYSDYILPPAYLGASTSAGALGTDIKAMLSYVSVLTSGNTNAQVVPALGNKYFLDTGGKCKDDKGKEHKRYIFINNIPEGVLGQGLIPGIIGNMTSINPGKIFTAFDDPTTCQKINMKIRDIENRSSNEEQYVCDSDIEYYNPCWFTERRNPVSNKNCVLGLTMRYEMPSDPMIQVYALSIYGLGAYLLYCLVRK